MKSTLLYSVLFMTVILVMSSRPMRPEENYVSQYRDIAIREMMRTGIPASIKLAQGVMESQSGRSELAIQANNHFGIKCKSNWNGATYAYKDDDLNDKGELVESCFRKYESPEQSYKDHSDFLKNRSRYKLLFEFDRSDYRSWARGLKMCGYATDPAYADKLIEIIERFELYNLDKEINNTDSVNVVDLIKVTERIPLQPAQVVLKESNTSIKSVIPGPVKNSLKKKKRKAHYVHQVAPQKTGLCQQKLLTNPQKTLTNY
ncbi:MAG: glucosaminidase domain-containing protein [Saprospiraceae bacterium]|nr:glucosaminidase domain-containing protein [Saprospiraceae bacterium]HMW39086.1 glucosaminidase domain-containing protein [Saprospiraceae bacterium]HMX87956.1 glucosaminidase domain-containing protein [Saprospiraceae bacterium]HMZ39994.1 glucosaminidase domain-containing protein [Saprospiraceae bacterium]HNA63769.1 glucosaminidase domain-containing protein [Saprospiraceae bacterium]